MYVVLYYFANIFQLFTTYDNIYMTNYLFKWIYLIITFKFFENTYIILMFYMYFI